MPVNSVYNKARQRGLEGGLNMAAGTVKTTLVDLNDYALLVNAATNATPIEITTTTSHGLTTGDEVCILAVGGNTAANNDSTNRRWKVTVVDADSFSLQNIVTGANVAGSGAYTSGGFVVKIDDHDFIDDVPSGARVATATLSSGKSTTRGIFDADNVTFTAVTGDQSEALIIWVDTGTESTSPLVFFISDATGLPATPSGADINVTWDNGYYKIGLL